MLTGGGEGGVSSPWQDCVCFQRIRNNTAPHLMIHHQADDSQNYSDWNTGTLLILHHSIVTLCTPTTGAQSFHINTK